VRQDDEEENGHGKEAADAEAGKEVGVTYNTDQGSHEDEEHETTEEQKSESSFVANDADEVDSRKDNSNSRGDVINEDENGNKGFDEHS
jgi:hypothetical protein